MKKVKAHFSGPSDPSNPSVTTRLMKEFPNYEKKSSLPIKNETARHEPGSRAVPVCPALFRFMPRKSKKSRFLGQKKLFNSKIDKCGMNRFTPQRRI